MYSAMFRYLWRGTGVPLRVLFIVGLVGIVPIFVFATIEMDAIIFRFEGGQSWAYRIFMVLTALGITYFVCIKAVQRLMTLMFVRIFCFQPFSEAPRDFLQARVDYTLCLLARELDGEYRSLESLGNCCEAEKEREKIWRMQYRFKAVLHLAKMAGFKVCVSYIQYKDIDLNTLKSAQKNGAERETRTP